MNTLLARSECLSWVTVKFVLHFLHLLSGNGPLYPDVLMKMLHYYVIIRLILWVE